MPQALFDALQRALVPYAIATRWELNKQSTSKFTPLRQDFLPGMLLCIVPLASAMRQSIQAPGHLDAELHFALDFYLPSPVACSQPS